MENCSAFVCKCARHVYVVCMEAACPHQIGKWLKPNSEKGVGDQTPFLGVAHPFLFPHSGPTFVAQHRMYFAFRFQGVNRRRLMKMALKLSAERASLVLDRSIFNKSAHKNVYASGKRHGVKYGTGLDECLKLRAGRLMLQTAEPFALSRSRKTERPGRLPKTARSFRKFAPSPIPAGAMASSSARSRNSISKERKSTEGRADGFPSEGGPGGFDHGMSLLRRRPLRLQGAQP